MDSKPPIKTEDLQWDSFWGKKTSELMALSKIIFMRVLGATLHSPVKTKSIRLW